MATSGGTSASVKLATGMHKKQSESCKWKENAGQIKKKEKVHSGERERYEKGDPEVDLLGEPTGKFEYYVLYSKREL